MKTESPKKKAFYILCGHISSIIHTVYVYARRTSDGTHEHCTDLYHGGRRRMEREYDHAPADDR